MRRVGQQLPDAEAISILQRATSGVLSLIGDNGYPYGVPISYVYRDGHLYMHTARLGHKVDALLTHAEKPQDPASIAQSSTKAAFCVIDQDEIHGAEYTTYFRSVICFGRVRLIEADDEKLAAAQWLGRRYNPGDEEGLTKEIQRAGRGMLMLDFLIEHLTGKESIELTKRRKKGD